MRYAEHVPGSGTLEPGVAARSPASVPSTGSPRRCGSSGSGYSTWKPTPRPGRCGKLDDTTGVLGEPEHTSGRIGADPNTAMDWAATIVPVESWVAFTDARTAFIDELHDLVRDIARRPRTGRTVVLAVEDDPHTPGRQLVVVRERWTATGRLSAPLHTRERAAFADDADMLTWASDRFGLDRQGWTTVTEGAEYHHP
jgi:hypothetical protein